MHYDGQQRSGHGRNASVLQVGDDTDAHFKEGNRQASYFARPETSAPSVDIRHLYPFRWVTNRGRVNAMSVRNAEPAEIPQLARIWFDAWQDAHAQILPAELARIRTLESFADRLRSALAETRVAGSHDAPVGFCIVRNDELYQLFVAASARGTGVAADLLVDAEARLTRRGCETAWLACAIGNERAARFYEKHGWSNVGTVVSQLDTPNGIFPLEVWRYEKRLR